MRNLVIKLNRLMAEKGYNCLELSKKTGIANTTLSTLLKGRTDKFDIVKLQKICDVLNCSLDYLMNDDIDDSSKTYYVNKETAQYAQEIIHNQDLKKLFDVAKDMRREDVQLVYEMVKRLRNNEGN